LRGTHAILRATSDGPGRGQSPASAGSTARAQPQRVRSMVGAHSTAGEQQAGCAAWRARSCRLQPELRASCRAGRARGPARGGVSLWPGGRQGTDYRRGPSARVPARVSGRAGGRGSTAGVGAEDARVPARGGTAATGGAQHSGRATRKERSTALSVQTSKQRSAPNLGVKGPELSGSRLQPELRSSCFRARAACGRRSQQSPC
jgi:hypothetical protein